MTTHNSSTNRLVWHSNGTTDADNPLNLSDYILMLKRGKESSSLEHLWTEVVSEFEQYNVKINRPGIEPHFDRSVLYAIHGMMILCFELFCDNTQEDNKRLLAYTLHWRISTAWDAVLAGDIDHIGLRVETEWKFRSGHKKDPVAART